MYVVSLREWSFLDVGASPHTPGIFSGMTRVSEVLVLVGEWLVAPHFTAPVQVTETEIPDAKGVKEGRNRPVCHSAHKKSLSQLVAAKGFTEWAILGSNQ